MDVDTKEPLMTLRLLSRRWSINLGWFGAIGAIDEDIIEGPVSDGLTLIDELWDLDTTISVEIIE